jgi:hypothetical protein
VNAEEIRQFASLSRGTSEECTVILLGEIAAQLAQLNDNVFAITERPIRVQAEVNNAN